MFETVVAIICFALSQSGKAVKYLDGKCVKPREKTSHAITDNKTTPYSTFIITFTSFYNQFASVTLKYLQTK